MSDNTLFIEVLPGILEQDFSEIVRKIHLVKNLVEWVHVDVLDRTLIDNQTYNQWEDFKQLRAEINLEAHLMVSKPHEYVDNMVKCGFERLIAHVESDHIREFLDEGAKYDVQLGVALDGPSEIDLIEPFLGEVDCVLLMMYTAGKSGQSFQKEQLTKIKQIRESYPDLPIEVDGGINKDTAILAKGFGANRLVSTSYLFWQNENNIEEAISTLLG